MSTDEQQKRGVQVGEQRISRQDFLRLRAKTTRILMAYFSFCYREE